MAVPESLFHSGSRPDRGRLVGACMAAALSRMGIRPHSLQPAAAHPNCADRLDGRHRRRQLPRLRPILGDTTDYPSPAEGYRRYVLRPNATSPCNHRGQTTPFLDRARLDSRDRSLGPRRLYLPCGTYANRLSRIPLLFRLHPVIYCFPVHSNVLRRAYA